MDDAVSCSSPNSGAFRLLNPDALVAGQPGEVLLAYRAGPGGMHPGDCLVLELPSAWYTRHSCSSFENLARFQAQDPESANYFGVLNADHTKSFSYRVVPNQRLTGDPNRFVGLLHIQLVQGELTACEEITILIRGWKERGEFKVPEAGGEGWIQGQLWVGNKRSWAASLEPVSLIVQSGPPMEVAVAVPSKGKVGETQTLKMRLLDANFNPVSMWPGKVRIGFPPGVEGLPDEVSAAQLNAYEDGLVTLAFRVTQAGTYRLRIVPSGLPAVWSNPLLVEDSPSLERTYWGDLHAHTELSKDGVGEVPFRYARDVSLLDFVATTEHNTEQDNPLAPVALLRDEEWDSLRQEVIDYNQPGEFVTLLAFENSAISPSGHQNVYYPTTDTPILLGGQLDKTWEEAKPYGALIIQHHSGIIWDSRRLPNILSRLFALLVEGSFVDWDAHSEIPRTALEIYSLHGQSEYYKPRDALSYENCGLGLPRDDESQNCPTGISKHGPHYARDAWARGLRMGTVAGSDDHRAQPGKSGGGLTAVVADSLARDSIFEAIQNRRTYATTGDRILLDFRINGAPMGSEIATSGPPEITVSVIGTAPLEYLQIMRCELGSGTWRKLYCTREHSRIVAITTTDASFSADSVYYVRLQQTNRTHGRPVRAWSSPIWVQKER